MADVEDDEVLEVDSPMEQPVDLEDDEDIEVLNDLQGGSQARHLPGHDSPIHARAKPEKREEMLDMVKVLPYPCESLDEFDQRVDYIARRLVDCVLTKEWVASNTKTYWKAKSTNVGQRTASISDSSTGTTSCNVFSRSSTRCSDPRGPDSPASTTSLLFCPGSRLGCGSWRRGCASRCLRESQSESIPGVARSIC